MPLTLKLQEVPVIIITCFVLHNWCEEHKVGIDGTAVNDQIKRDLEMQPSRTTDRRYTFNSSEGTKIRDIIKDCAMNACQNKWCLLQLLYNMNKVVCDKINIYIWTFYRQW